MIGHPVNTCTFLVEISCLWKVVLIKVNDYLTFMTVTGMFNPGVNIYFSKLIKGYLPVPLQNIEG